MSVQSEIERIKAGKEDIRAAIVEKGQSVPATARLSSYGDKIRAIQTGTDTSDATAAAGDILSGKTAYVKGKKVTGTIASKTASNLTASGSSIIVPAGYYPSQVSKNVESAAQAKPSITVSSDGLITAGVTQEAGYVASGTKSATKQLTTQAAQTITPGTKQKTAVASGRYTTGAVNVAGDANLIAANIKKGVSIFDIVGTYMPNPKIYTYDVDGAGYDLCISTSQMPDSVRSEVTKAPCIVCIAAKNSIINSSQSTIVAGVAYTTAARDDFFGATDIPSMVVYQSYTSSTDKMVVHASQTEGALIMNPPSSGYAFVIRSRVAVFSSNVHYRVIIFTGAG